MTAAQRGLMPSFQSLSVRDLVALVVIAFDDQHRTADPATRVRHAYEVADAVEQQSNAKWAQNIRNGKK